MFLSVSSFSFGQDIYAKYLEEAKSFYLIRDYGKELSRIQFVLKNYETTEEVPEEERTVAEKIYYAYLKNLSDSKDYDAYWNFVSSDAYYGALSGKSQRIKDLEQRNNDIRISIRREEELARALEEERARAKALDAVKREAEEKYRKEMERIEEERRKEQERVIEERKKEMERIAEERKKEAERINAERKMETQKMLEAEAARRKQDEAARRTEQENLMKFQ